MCGGKIVLEYPVLVKERKIQQEMEYKNESILKYTIKYPQFVSLYFREFLEKLNEYYSTRALMYEKSNVMKMFQLAMVEYEYSVANNFPIRQFEAYKDYQVGYNQNCAISLYFDQYEYTGGAHGNTIRRSDSWNLRRSKKIELNDVFTPRDNLREYLVGIINQQIKQEASADANTYFEDYSSLVEKNFKMNSFFLTKEGVVLYFQQYEIAPYASGIPTFLIRYGEEGAVSPSCC